MKKNLSKIADPGESKAKSLLNFISFIFTKPGISLLKRIIKKALLKAGVIREQRPSYSDWIKAQLNPALLQKDFDTHFNGLKLKPKISIVLPVEDVQDKYLSASVDSVTGQSYGNWELLIVSSHPAISIIKDERIVLGMRNEDAATGEYVLFMAAGDILTTNCVFELVKHINSHPSDELIYTDEDIAEENGSYTSPRFKPGWSQDSLLARNYIGHTMAIRKELLERVKGGDRINHYDLVLRATELTKNIGHIPKVLFHSRKQAFSDTGEAASIKALKEAMIRRGTPANVTTVQGAQGGYQLNYEIKKKEKVSVIIPTKDNTELLKKAVDSILQKTDYPDYEIVVLNNNSTSKEFFQLMKDYEGKHPGIFRCIDAAFPFNFAKLMNMGVAESKGSYILMCNNDIEVIHNDWMTQMVSHAQNKWTGAVGVKLLYPDNTIQHAGIVLDAKEGSRHVFVNKPRDADGYCYSLKAVTNYAAVTAACMMCRKELFTEVGGMDEELAVEYNDVDFCLKLLQKGYYNLYLPTVELYHYESATRGHPFRSKASWEQHEKELGIFKSKWQRIIDNDPFYNPNLSLGIRI